MSELDRYILRISAPTLAPHENLSSHLETLDDTSVDAVINELEYAVSQGHLGLAAELSDRLLADGAALLDRVPSRRIRVELERMKRLTYYGYKAPARDAAERRGSAGALVATAVGWWPSR